MRLTRFNNLTKEYEYHLNNPNTSMIQDEIAGIQKLGQLEDIEDELGIDLITLFKALANGIYEKLEDGKYIKFNGACLPIKPHKLKLNVHKKCFERGNEYYYFKDYGKTWALTKEELL